MQAVHIYIILNIRQLLPSHHILYLLNYNTAVEPEAYLVNSME